MVIRRIEASEWRSLRELRLRALEDAPDAFGETLAQARARPDDEWVRWADRGWGTAPQLTIVADEDGTLGALIVGILGSDGTSVHIYSMWVAPEIRGRGVGRALIERVADWARDRGAERLVLGVTGRNTGAYEMYRACGFSPTGDGTYPLRDGSALTCITMERALGATPPA